MMPSRGPGQELSPPKNTPDFKGCIRYVSPHGLNRVSSHSYVGLNKSTRPKRQSKGINVGHDERYNYDEPPCPTRQEKEALLARIKSKLQCFYNARRISREEFTTISRNTFYAFVKEDGHSDGGRRNNSSICLRGLHLSETNGNVGQHRNVLNGGSSIESTYDAIDEQLDLVLGPQLQLLGIVYPPPPTVLLVKCPTRSSSLSSSFQAVQRSSIQVTEGQLGLLPKTNNGSTRESGVSPTSLPIVADYYCPTAEPTSVSLPLDNPQKEDDRLGIDDEECTHLKNPDINVSEHRLSGSSDVENGSIHKTGSIVTMEVSESPPLSMATNKSNHIGDKRRPVDVSTRNDNVRSRSKEGMSSSDSFIPPTNIDMQVHLELYVDDHENLREELDELVMSEIDESEGYKYPGVDSHAILLVRQKHHSQDQHLIIMREMDGRQVILYEEMELYLRLQQKWLSGLKGQCELSSGILAPSIGNHRHGRATPVTLPYLTDPTHIVYSNGPPAPSTHLPRLQLKEHVSSVSVTKGRCEEAKVEEVVVVCDDNHHQQQLLSMECDEEYSYDTRGVLEIPPQRTHQKPDAIHTSSPILHSIYSNNLKNRASSRNGSSHQYSTIVRGVSDDVAAFSGAVDTPPVKRCSTHVAFGRTYTPSRSINTSKAHVTPHRQRTISTTPTRYWPVASTPRRDVSNSDAPTRASTNTPRQMVIQRMSPSVSPKVSRGTLSQSSRGATYSSRDTTPSRTNNASEGSPYPPSRDALVEYIRETLQPIFNAGKLPHEAFVFIVKQVSVVCPYNFEDTVRNNIRFDLKREQRHVNNVVTEDNINPRLLIPKKPLWQRKVDQEIEKSWLRYIGL